MTESLRMILKAFVCEHGCVRVINNIGSSTFVDIISLKPDECRYAIVEVSNGYWILDLLLTDVNNSDAKTELTYPTLEAAMMAATLTY